MRGSRHNVARAQEPACFCDARFCDVDENRANLADTTSIGLAQSNDATLSEPCGARRKLCYRWPLKRSPRAIRNRLKSGVAGMKRILTAIVLVGLATALSACDKCGEPLRLFGQPKSCSDSKPAG